MQHGMAHREIPAQDPAYPLDLLSYPGRWLEGSLISSA